MDNTQIDWAVVDDGVMVHGFSASQSYVDDYSDLVVDRADRVTPGWWHDGVDFVNLTNVDPRPFIGWYKLSDGSWADGNPSLTTDRELIPSDGKTTATVIFAQKGPNAPSAIEFNVNGQIVPDTLVNGVATLEITSNNPGDVVTVSVASQMITINVEV